MEAYSLLFAVLASSLAGAGVGLCTGLVPGLHVNNVAAVVVAGSASAVSAFGALGSLFGCVDAAVLISSFLVAALVAHMFSESIVATYLGIPSGDTVSLLPAHRLARMGLGGAAVRASADGSLSGAALGLLLLPSVCLILGPPVDAYSSIRQVMGIVVALMSAALVVSDGLGHGDPVRRAVLASTFFLVSGLLGFIVLDTNYYACEVPDFPWIHGGFVRASSLLLPLFAGLFGVPTLLLSLGSRGEVKGDADEGSPRRYRIDTDLRPKEVVLSSLGGLLVGWIPGMTSGSSATMCASISKDAAPEGGGPEEAARFIWLYSAISSCGAVLSVGALFVISRARSGIMQAVVHFLGDKTLHMDGLWSVTPMAAMLMSMLLSAAVCHRLICGMSATTISRLQRMLCSDNAAVLSLAFVTSLVLCLTGVRGALLFVAAGSLGLLPPMSGVRRINLMGCLLVPICVTFLFG
ncbi:MAG: tripartite tricarboxylate transporter permease [Methanobacteriota archaeon]|nr:MAG: tripartite tricarboxylate transporter permease [Euryarchaeota archaeon]